MTAQNVGLGNGLTYTEANKRQVMLNFLYVYPSLFFSLFSNLSKQTSPWTPARPRPALSLYIYRSCIRTSSIFRQQNHDVFACTSSFHRRLISPRPNGCWCLIELQDAAAEEARPPLVPDANLPSFIHVPRPGLRSCRVSDLSSSLLPSISRPRPKT
jgi:hypothetical protein